MPGCPQCGNRLRFESLMSGGGVVCPHCYAELEPIRWIAAVLHLTGVAVLFGLVGLLHSAGVAKGWTMAAVLPVYFVAMMLLYARCARYRVKKPVSILHG